MPQECSSDLLEPGLRLNTLRPTPNDIDSYQQCQTNSGWSKRWGRIRQPVPIPARTARFGPGRLDSTSNRPGHQQVRRNTSGREMTRPGDTRESLPSSGHLPQAFSAGRRLPIPPPGALIPSPGCKRLAFTTGPDPHSEGSSSSGYAFFGGLDGFWFDNPSNPLQICPNYPLWHTNRRQHSL